MTMWYVEQDQRVVFWQTVSQQILTTKLFFWRQVLKIGRGKSTCLLHLSIIFVTKSTTGFMKQNHKSLWTTGNKMMFMYSTYLQKSIPHLWHWTAYHLSHYYCDNRWLVIPANNGMICFLKPVPFVNFWNITFFCSNLNVNKLLLKVQKTMEGFSVISEPGSQ